MVIVPNISRSTARVSLVGDNSIPAAEPERIKQEIRKADTNWTVRRVENIPLWIAAGG